MGKLSSKKSVRFVAALGAFAAVAGLCSSAQAIVLTAGAAPSTTVGAGSYSGTLIYDSGNVPFTGLAGATPVFTGLLDSKVYKEAGGTLDFVYQFSNDNVPLNDPINRFTASYFQGFTVNADYTLVGGGNKSAKTVALSADGQTVAFSYVGVEVDPGDTTTQMVVRTNAINYSFGSASIQNSGNVSVSIPAPVPEPTAGVMLLAASGLAFGRRRAR